MTTVALVGACSQSTKALAVLLEKPNVVVMDMQQKTVRLIKRYAAIV